MRTQQRSSRKRVAKSKETAARQSASGTRMGCFPVQRSKKKPEDQTVKLDEASNQQETPSSSPRPVLSAPSSFRRKVRAIQNAQKFILHCTPKLSPSHHSHDSTESSHSSTSDQGIFLSDVSTHSKPMPLPSPSPSPQPSLKPNGYVLPHPTISPKSHDVNGKQTSTGFVGCGAQLKGRVFPSDLRPLPPPKDALGMTLGLKSFAFETLSSACQHFSPHSCVGDDGISYAGTIKVGIKGDKHQEVLITRLYEKSHLGLKEWISELSTITCLHDSHLCKLVGFYAEDGRTECFLVYEKLQKGSLHNLMFEASASPPLDWTARMKIAHGAAQGLATLHEKYPEQILYKDFRLSHIQVDVDYSSKLSGYWCVSSSSPSLQAQDFNSSSNARENAYCAPEMVSGGVITMKSNVWSFGVVLLELLTGRKNMDERMAKDQKQTLVKWVKPFLIEEGKLFLIMDPKLQGRFPSKGTRIIADLALQCLQKDPTRRPAMKVVLDMVKSVLEMRYTTRFPLKEPSKDVVNTPAAARPLRSLAASSSLKTGFLDIERRPPSYIRSPTQFDLIESPLLKPLTIPPRSCVSSFAREGVGHHHQQQDYSSAPLERVKGF